MENILTVLFTLLGVFFGFIVIMYTNEALKEHKYELQHKYNRLKLDYGGVKLTIQEKAKEAILYDRFLKSRRKVVSLKLLRELYKKMLEKFSGSVRCRLKSVYCLLLSFKAAVREIILYKEIKEVTTNVKQIS